MVKTPHTAVDQEVGSDQEQRQTSNDHSYLSVSTSQARPLKGSIAFKIGSQKGEQVPNMRLVGISGSSHSRQVRKRTD